ncbi:hypothetical protein B9T26_09275 [Acinetobacter sp. ANC 4169]|uniref:hypothetical protein n=1 Tax=Acinetobacter sp. ANC 4169 TaxID=1977879 RepID=UPI000A32D74D|nr:hypothetical protein [Acinetobacter sp. ANC 4169]OTG73266.1 hypothetical protein B9T26_09275 [Acinetobacter sp. ANC 4169]
MAQQENAQAVILQQLSGQQLVIKIEQDTDWISIGAIVMSLLAFIVTIYIVRKSTQGQIESNKNLIESQEKQKQIETHYHKNKDWIQSVIEQRVRVYSCVREYTVNYTSTIQLINECIQSNACALIEENFNSELTELAKQGNELIEQLDRLQALVELQNFATQELSVDFENMKMWVSKSLDNFAKRKFKEDELNELKSLHLVLQKILKHNLKLIFNNQKAA